MAQIPDIVVRDRAGRTVLVAEVKALDQLSIEDADFMRASVIPPGPSAVPYFLAVSRTDGFLWVNGDGDEPTARFPMGDVVAGFGSRTSRQAAVGGAVLEAIVARWLTDLTFSKQTSRSLAEETLRAHGVLDTIAGGHVMRQTPVENEWTSTSSRISF